jgi:cellulose biosynthesis protein BcsQ
MIHFDATIDEAVRVLREHFAGGVKEVTIVRDASGMLSAVLEDDALPAGEWDLLGRKLHAALEPFSPGSERVLLRKSDLIDPDDILRSPDRVGLPEYKSVFLVDRLQTNQDWLRPPLVNVPQVPLATAFSIKGGVGRSTAVALLAWHLAKQGRRVLVVDLDLEAPGIASLLLPDLPTYGLIDWLVESVARGTAPDFLEDTIMVSPVGEDEPGLVRVLPAFGTKTRDYIAKLGRVYMPTAEPSGQLHGIAHRLNLLISQMCELSEPPDVVLLDSRAGLHDIGAAAVTQLGAQVFMFARNDRQTWEAYKQLFQHLRLSRGVHWGMPEDDLRWHMKMVAAQVNQTESALVRATEASFETWTEFYDAEELAGKDREPNEADEPQLFGRDETQAPHYPLPIYFDTGMQGLQLVDKGQRPPWRVVEATFGVFLDDATKRLTRTAPDEEAQEGEGST